MLGMGDTTLREKKEGKGSTLRTATSHFDNQKSGDCVNALDFSKGNSP